MMTKAGNELAIVDHPLLRQAAEQLIIFGFLSDDVKHDPLRIHMIEDDLPLIELTDVVGQPVGGVV